MTTATSRTTVVGVFHDREHARDAIEALKNDGFDPDTISILSPDKQATQDIAEETGTHAGSGAATGAIAGGILGGLGGWLLGIGALAIPGIGPFIAAGAFASAIGGAALGAGVGAIAGALVGMGVPEEHAEYYEGEAKAGKTLVTVRAPERYDEAQRILRGAVPTTSNRATLVPPTLRCSHAGTTDAPLVNAAVPQTPARSTPLTAPPPDRSARTARRCNCARKSWLLARNASRPARSDIGYRKS